MMLVFPHEAFGEATREVRVQAGGEGVRWKYVLV